MAPLPKDRGCKLKIWKAQFGSGRAFEAGQAFESGQATESMPAAAQGRRRGASGPDGLRRCALERNADFLGGAARDANRAGLAAVAAVAVLDVHPAATLGAFGFGQRE